ncbi:MAG: hypothetical protein R2734_14575 [Nocardioides sp.]
MASPVPSPTGLAAELAKALAHGRQHVLFVDAVSTAATDRPGFTDALGGSDELETMIVSSGELSVLPIGTDPGAGRGCTARRGADRVLRRATGRFDWVIIHAPDTGQTSGRALVAGCDYWIPTVAIGADTRDELERGLGSGPRPRAPRCSASWPRDRSVGGHTPAAPLAEEPDDQPGEPDDQLLDLSADQSDERSDARRRRGGGGPHPDPPRRRLQRGLQRGLRRDREPGRGRGRDR